MKALTLLLCTWLLTMSTVYGQGFKTETLVTGLEHPWAMAFLPNKNILITERPGRLRLIENGKLNPKPIKGLPSIAARGQGGLLDIALHPNYANNGWLYFSYVEKTKQGYGTNVARARLNKLSLINVEVIFRINNKTDSGRHFGSRLIFDRQGKLYISIGDRGDRPRAQDLNDHAGSIIRLNDDGSIPSDNPYSQHSNKQAAIYSYGHRNPQGLALHPNTGRLWSHEHGPKGGDEINIIQAGLNYGWPIITYGKNYLLGTSIGEGQHKAGMEQPLYQWTPSIAPSGMAFYSGDKFKHWQGNLFVGSLKFQLLVRLKLDGEKVIKEERLLEGKFGRIRDVRNGPDGYLYLLTDDDDGRLVRLIPDI